MRCRVCERRIVTQTNTRWVPVCAASPSTPSAQGKDLLLGPLRCPMHLDFSFSRPLLLSRGLQGQPHSGLHNHRWWPDGVEGALGLLEPGEQSSKPDSSSLPRQVTLPL